MGALDRQIYREILVSVCVGDFRLETSNKLYKLFNDLDVNQGINNRRLGQVDRMKENVLARWIIDSRIDVGIGIGRP